MNQKIKIAHLQLLPMLSGVQQVSYQELSRLSSDAYVRRLLCKEAGALTDALLEQGVEPHFIGDLQRAISPKNDWKAFRALKSHFSVGNYDVVHTHSSKTGFLGRVAAWMAGVPCIVHTVHGFAFPAARNKLEYFVYWLLEWIAGRCSDAVIVLTESDREICLRSLGLKPEKVHLIPNAVDGSVYFPVTSEEKGRMRESLLGAGDGCVAMMVGRLWKQKAPEVLVEAAITAFQSDPGFALQLYLVGDGELKQSLEERVAEAGLSEHIHFLGWRSDVSELLKAADIFVLPSRWEGMPLAILEALASRLAVVASDIPGNRAALQSGACGKLFPVEDSDALADALKQWVKNQESRESIAERGYNHVVENHDLDKRIGTIEELYQGILGR